MHTTVVLAHCFNMQFLQQWNIHTQYTTEHQKSNLQQDCNVPVADRMFSSSSWFVSLQQWTQTNPI